MGAEQRVAPAGRGVSDSRIGLTMGGGRRRLNPRIGLGGGILTARIPEASATLWTEGRATTRSLAFRLPVSGWRFAGQREVQVEGLWGHWRSTPQAVRVP